MTLSTIAYTYYNNQMTASVEGPMKTVSYMMPVIFMFVLNSFSSGLTYYYFVSNIITIVQQLVIRRFVDEDKIRKVMEENRKKNLANPDAKKSSFQQRLADALKAQEELKDLKKNNPKK
jgi:YidC/Oxa1 family membrane protein insertase